jgi:hypothetical protein
MQVINSSCSQPKPAGTSKKQQQQEQEQQQQQQEQQQEQRIQALSTPHHIQPKAAGRI